MRLTIGARLRGNPSATARHTYEFSDQGVRVAHDFGQSELKWPAVVRVVETRDDLLFYTGKQVFFFLAKHAVERPDDLRKLREIIRSQVGDRAQLRDESA
jgi:hypothetical protein